MTQTIPPLITTLDQAKEGIQRFQSELASTDLIELLSHFRAWYAITDEEGNILLAPSKFIGYQGLTAKNYREAARQTDGRDTERVLRRWFAQPDIITQRILTQELSKLVGKFGKTIHPNARVSTIDGFPLTGGALGDENKGASMSPIDAIVVLYRMLTDSEQREVRRRLTNS